MLLVTSSLAFVLDKNEFNSSSHSFLSDGRQTPCHSYYGRILSILWDNDVPA